MNNLKTFNHLLDQYHIVVDNRLVVNGDGWPFLKEPFLLARGVDSRKRAFIKIPLVLSTNSGIVKSYEVTTRGVQIINGIIRTSFVVLQVDTDVDVFGIALAPYLINADAFFHRTLQKTTYDFSHLKKLLDGEVIQFEDTTRHVCIQTPIAPKKL